MCQLKTFMFNGKLFCDGVRIHKQGKTLGATASGTFGISSDALKGLMKFRKREAIDNIQKLGRIDKLCQNLCSSPTNGISYIFIHEYQSASLKIRDTRPCDDCNHCDHTFKPLKVNQQILQKLSKFSKTFKTI